MTQRDFIMQLDYKDDLENYIIFIKDFWQDTKTKVIQFILHNDQQYVARVPVDANVEQMYEVILKNVKV